jgi:hypothetical protein
MGMDRRCNREHRRVIFRLAAVILWRRERARTWALLALLALLLAVVFAGGFAEPAVAQEEKSFDLPSAYVVADVQPDGSVLVTELTGSRNRPLIENNASYLVLGLS